MVDTKISGMTAAAVLTGTELLPVLQTGTNATTTPNALNSYLTIPITFLVTGKPATGQVYNWVAPFPITIPANFAGTTIYDGTVATSNALFRVNRISGNVIVPIGDIIITSTSHTSCTLTTWISSQTSFTVSTGEVLQLVAPTQDATLADISVTFLATQLFDLDLNFIASMLDPRITFTRAAGAATYFDSTGTLQTAATNVPRFDYGPAPGATNWIRNSTATGAIVGTPGTFPTNWSVALNNGLSRTIIGSGTESGIPYVDVEVFGTATAGIWDLSFETTTNIAALTGQIWTESVYVRLTAGTLTNVTTQLRWVDYTSGGVLVAGATGTNFIPTSAALTTQRNVMTFTTSGGATVAFIQPQIQVTTTVGAVDATFRIGGVQLEQGSTANPYIPSTSVAVTVTTPKGLLFEETRANSIRNNTMVGAAAGSPGTPPTNWGAISGLGPASLTPSVVGTGTESGISYIDLSVIGTANASTQGFIAFDSNITSVAAQVWTQSAYLRLMAGSLTGVSGLGLQLNPMGTQVTATPTNAALATQRISGQATATGTTVQPYFVFNVTNGAAINFTIRIGLPQLELGTYVTSAIPTSTVAVTRAADAASMTLGTWFSLLQGTLEAEYFAINAPATGFQGGVVRIDDGSANNNNIIIIFLGSSGVSASFSSVASITQLNTAYSSAIAAIDKQAIAYGKNAWSAIFNNGTITTIAGTTPTAATRLLLGTTNATGVNWMLNGYLRRVRFWSRTLATTELQTITT